MSVDVQGIGAIVGGAAAAAALVYLHAQIEVGRRQQRVERTYHYFNRYTDWAFVERIHAGRAVWRGAAIPPKGRAPQSADEWLRWWKLMAAHPINRNELLLVVNFWLELGSLVRQRLLDAPIAKELFASVSSSYYDEIENLIVALRQERGDGEVAREWEEMNHRFGGTPWISGRSARTGSFVRCEPAFGEVTALSTYGWVWRRSRAPIATIDDGEPIPGLGRDLELRSADAGWYVACALSRRTFGGSAQDHRITRSIRVIGSTPLQLP